MEHLKNKEILDFIKISEYNDETSALVKKVNRHILSCKECAEKVSQACRAAEILEIMNRDGFRNTDVFTSMYEIPADAVAAETASVSEEGDGTVLNL